jgi:ABC-type phosphate/phosphonate transport system substrate-binding protein
MSGWLSLARDLGGDPGVLAGAVIETGGHRASIRAVAEGRADLTAIDCRSWALALRHEPCAQDLVVVGWTGGAAGPALCHRSGYRREDGARLRETLIGMGCHPPQEMN